MQQESKLFILMVLVVKMVQVKSCLDVVLMKWFDGSPYSAGIDFRRHILTSKVYHRTISVKILTMAVDT